MTEKNFGWVVANASTREEWYFESRAAAENKMDANTVLKAWDPKDSEMAVYNRNTHLIKRLSETDPSPLGFIMLQPIDSGYDALPRAEPYHVQWLIRG